MIHGAKGTHSQNQSTQHSSQARFRRPRDGAGPSQAEGRTPHRHSPSRPIRDREQTRWAGTTRPPPKAAQRGAGPAAALQWGPGQHCSAEAKGRCKRQSNGPANEFTRCSRARPCVRLQMPALPSLKPPRPASPRLHPGPRVRVSGGGGCEGRAISAEGGGGGGRRPPPRS